MCGGGHCNLILALVSRNLFNDNEDGMIGVTVTPVDYIMSLGRMFGAGPSAYQALPGCQPVYDPLIIVPIGQL